MRWPALLLLAAALAGCFSSGTPPGSGQPSGSDATLSPAPSTSQGTTSTTPPSQPPAGDPSPSAANGTAGPTNATGSEDNQTYDPKPFEPQEPSGTCGANGSLEPIAPDPALASGLVDGWPTLVVTIAVLADPAFVKEHPDDWRPLLTDLVADASTLLEDQVGLRIDLVLLDRLPDGSLAPGTGDGQQRAVARGYMAANHPGVQADIVAVIVGADYEGTTLGSVECVHGAKYPEYSFLWAEYVFDRPVEPFAASLALVQDWALKTLVHEASHLLAAHHHYSNCGEAVLLYYRPDNLMGVCDLMINDASFASFHLGPTNRWVMRSFVESIGIAEPAPP